MTNTTRTYRRTDSSLANDLFGAVNTTVVEVLTVKDGGILVAAHMTGTVEGDRVDSRSSKFWPGADLETAHAWRMRNGYTLVGGGS